MRGALLALGLTLAGCNAAKPAASPQPDPLDAQLQNERVAKLENRIKALEGKVEALQILAAARGKVRPVSATDGKTETLQEMRLGRLEKDRDERLSRP